MSASQPMSTSAPRAPHSSHAHDVLLGILPLLFALELLLWIAFFPLGMRGHTDFRQLYVAGYMVRTGHLHELYDYELQRRLQDELVVHEELPFNHLSYEALCFAPLSFLPYRSAYPVSIVINFALLLVAYRLLRPHQSNLRQRWNWFPICLFALFLPVQVTLMQGQDSILLLLILTAAYVLLSKGRDLEAGAVAALGLFKFQIVLPLVAIYFLRKHWRFCTGFAISAVLVVGLSTALVGVQQMTIYVRSLGSMSVGLTSRADQLRFGIFPGHMANLRGLIYGLNAGLWPNAYVQRITILLSVVILVAFGLLFLRRLHAANLVLPAVVVAVLASYHILTHDLSVLLFPIVLTLDGASLDSLHGRFVGWTAFVMYLAPLCLLIAPHHFYLVSLATILFLVALVWSQNTYSLSVLEKT